MHFRFACLLTTFIALPVIATASVGKISGPEVEKGELEAKYLMTHTEDDTPSKDGNESHRAEFEYGFTENWAAEIGFRFDDKYREDLDLKSVYVEALRTLTRQSDGWWLSSGLLGEYAANTDHGPNKVETQLRLQRSEELFRLRFNTTLEREIGGGDEDEVELGTRASFMLKTHARINPGIEWHAEWGTLSHISDRDDQKHWVGPAIYGKLFETPEGGEVEYQLGYMFGVTDPSEDGVARFVLEYKREF